MTHWRQCVDSTKYVNEGDLDGREWTVKIASARGGVGEGENKRKFRKPFLTFAGPDGPVFVDDEGKPKPFGPSNTDCKTLVSLTGSPHIEDWVGVIVRLYPTTTKLKGETVPCIRIRNVLPKVGGKDQVLKRSGHGAAAAGTATTPAPTPVSQPTEPTREPGSDDQ